MVILFVLLTIICLWNNRISNFHEDYMSPKATNAIKGIFAVIILYSHLNGYIMLSDDMADSSFRMILGHIGQLMVAPYLFYSGYGISESMKRKSDYFESYPKKRILKTLVHFDLAVLCYLLLMTVIGTYYPAVNYITCWIGWDSIGNSNWFIFDILALYCIVYIAHCFIHYNKVKNYLGGVTIVTTLLCVPLWIALFFAGKGSWWIDTVITFPLGMWFSLLKDNIENVLRVPQKGTSVMILLVLFFIVWHFIKGNDVFGISASIFCISLVVLSSRIKFDNKILQLLGNQSFAIYIMQRLPMNLYQSLGLNDNPYIFTLVSIPSVLMVSWLFNLLLNKIDLILFNHRIICQK